MYENYLNSTHWKKTRKRKLFTAPNCQICESDKNIHIHHLRYKYRDDERLVKIGRANTGTILGKEKDGELLALCASCHKLTHFYFGTSIKKKQRRQLRKLLRIGVVKKRAFWIVSDPQLMSSMYTKLIRL